MLTLQYNHFTFTELKEVAAKEIQCEVLCIPANETFTVDRIIRSVYVLHLWKYQGKNN